MLREYNLQVVLFWPGGVPPDTLVFVNSPFVSTEEFTFTSTAQISSFCPDTHPMAVRYIQVSLLFPPIRYVSS